MLLNLLALSCLLELTHAHIAAYANGMFCLNGTVPGVDNNNNADPVSPLWMLSKQDYWFHHFNGCDDFPPAPGDFLKLPVGGSFNVELAGNRAQTSLSYDCDYCSDWPDGGQHPDGWDPGHCISQPNIHTPNETMAAGTAFAISYESDISKVTIDNLAVFTVRYNTPWKRVTSYDVPKNMPPCPADGCTCAWVWIPNGCGEPNIYMQGFKCMVTGATSNVPIATPKPPVWCEEDQSTCVQGSKQIMIWNQMEGNNVAVSGFDAAGDPKSPAYNSKCGFKDGAQNDIFATANNGVAVASPSSTTSSTTSSTSSSTTSTSTQGAATLNAVPTNISISTATITSTVYITTTVQAPAATCNTTTSHSGNILLASASTSSTTSTPTCSSQTKRMVPKRSLRRFVPFY